ncbi:MAG: helix-turn-helix domain-containing protein [Clostridiales bacterium]|nr:helix-turn-helix domain-containing protein [Clostridiales bacterium]
MTTKDYFKMPICDKYGLTINEAAQYFGIGENKLRQIVSENINTGNFNVSFTSGNRYIIKRKKFEEYLDNLEAV